MLEKNDHNSEAINDSFGAKANISDVTAGYFRQHVS